MNRPIRWLAVLALAVVGMASSLCVAQGNAPKTDRLPPPPPVADAAVLDGLEPSSKRLVEEHAKYFVVTVDGTYWDRQVWLRRQELRDRMRKAAAGDQSPSDIERAHGASSTAPMDPDDETDGIERPDGKYRYKRDLTNPPMWRAMGDRTGITGNEICSARNHLQGMEDDTEGIKRPDRNKVPAGSRERPLQFRSVSADELAQAIKGGRAEQSKFAWRKRVIKPAFVPTKDKTKIEYGRPATAEEAEFSWFRTPMPVYWKKPAVEKPAAPAATPEAPAAPGKEAPSPAAPKDPGTN